MLKLKKPWMKWLAKYLPLILLLLTLLTLIVMIAVRVSAAGLRLFSVSSGTGKFLAGLYHSSVIVFLVFLVASAAVCVTWLLLRKKKIRSGIPETVEIMSPDISGIPEPVQAQDAGQQRDVSRETAAAVMEPESK